ncbi:MAG: hypothetical protein CSA42_08075 [Gammaproteobacteria bacterium]|nr:MAG: hypothetical protein CSA42_08075 [Gammaproteobacteria bacterium]
MPKKQISEIKHSSPKRKGLFNFLYRIFSFSFGNTIKQVSEGLYIEALRDLVKWFLAVIGTFLISLFATGIGNFDWSFRSFNLFNKINTINRVNDEIRPDAIWKIPKGITVKVKDAGFLTFTKFDSYYKAVEITYISKSNQKKVSRLTPGNVFEVEDNCQSLGFINMQNIDDENFLLLYNNNEDLKCAYTK